MNLFFKRSKTKEYNLWHDWYVMLEGKYKLLDNGDSGQLYNHDVSRVIYGSVFKLEGDMPIKDEIILNTPVNSGVFCYSNRITRIFFI